MPHYYFQAKGFDGKVVSGSLDAQNEEVVVALLERQGLFPVKVWLNETGTFHRTLKMEPAEALRLSKRDATTFIHQFYDLISSGVSLVRGLEIIHKEASSPILKRVLQVLIENVKAGQRLSDALRLFPKTFSPFFVNLIRSGEASGSLDQVLLRLSQYYESQDEMRSKIKTAMAYPLFVFMVGIGVIIVLLVFVVPRMSNIFSDLGQNMPWVTKVLIGLSSGLVVYGWIVVLLAILIFFFFRSHLSSQEGRKFWENIRLKLPILGKIHHENEISKFARTLHMLLSNGVVIVQALDIAASVLTDHTFRDELLKLKEELGRGKRVRDVFGRSAFLPPHVMHMMMIGEETGQMERSLLRIADSYERSVERSLKMGTALLEPVMILLIGSFVGFIAFAMLLPIFEVNFLIR